MARIEEVDEEVGGMLRGWRSVEEGGRSLQEACQRLLEERVSCLLGFALGVYGCVDERV